MSPAPLFTMTLETGHAWMRGPPCPNCDAGSKDPVTGVIVMMPAKGLQVYTCWRCGGDIDARMGYMAPQVGKVEVLPEINGELSENPYLFPRQNPFSDDPLDPEDDDASNVWFQYGLDDIGNAQRLHAMHGGWFRYVHEWGWLVYDGRRWIPDKVGAMQWYAKHVVKSMISACGEKIPLNSDEGKSWLKHAKSSASKGRMEAMVDLARSEPGTTRVVTDFDSDPEILNVRNGVVHLPTGQLRAHRIEDYCTRFVDVQFDQMAECPRWDQFLAEITCHDKELIEYLQTAVGYSLTGSTREQKLFFLFGDGANGKSTFLEIIRELAGEYGHTLPFEAFLRSRTKDTSRHLADLPGRRFVTAVEAGEGRAFDEEMVKSVTGQDMIVGRQLYREAFSFRPSATVWLAANDKPAIGGANEGIWRRFHVIPLQADIPPEARDPYLRDKLLEELPGILAWAVRGAVRWHVTGLEVPTLVREALEEYRAENNTVERFIEEWCNLDDEITTTSCLLEHYNAWAKKAGEREMNSRMFSHRLRRFRAGRLKPEKSFGQRGWLGISIKPNVRLGEHDDPQRRF